jgi:PAS domain S-box-containing protein
MYRILYVDDEPTLLEVGKIYLERSGKFSVDIITSAPAALALLESKTYDAIIADYQMPDMDGIEFLKKVRGSGNTISFILFTGRGREEVVIQALNEGADFYLQKGGEPMSQFAELEHQLQQAIQQRQAQATIRESEEKYRTLYDNMQEGFAYCRMLYDNEGRPDDIIFVNVNAAFNRIINIPALVNSNQRLSEVMPGLKEAFPEVFKIYGKVALTGIPEVFDLNFTPIGKWLHISIYSPAKEYFVTVFSDITKHKTADEKIRESEERYRNVVEDQTEFICRFTPEGTHVFVNDAYCRYFGLKREEILGHQFRPKILEEDRERVRRFLVNLTQEHPVDTIEHRIIMPDGSIRWQRWIDRAIFDDSGNLVEYQSVGQDITERKQVEDELCESEGRFAAFMDHLPVTAFIKDEQFTNLFVNRHMVEVFGEQEWIGKSVYEQFPKEAAEKMIDDDQQTLREGYRINTEYLVDQEGDKKIFETHKFRIDRGNNPPLIGGFAVDITERKKAEEASRQANRKLALLINITRHDISNQILALNGFVELLREKIPDPALENYFTWIKQASTRISSIGQFAKIYSTIGETAPRWHDIRTLVDTAARQVSLGKILVKNDLPAGTEVFADPLIFKVFYNLIENAVRYGRKITTIRFSAEECNGNRVVVCEDDGVGIPAEDKGRIFDWGFGENTGLGLALSREILDLTGITIRETGEPGKGARFEIIVPPSSFRIQTTRANQRFC